MFLDRNADVATGNSSKTSSPRQPHGRRGSADEQRRTGAIASLAGLTGPSGSPAIKGKLLHSSPTPNNQRQRRAKSTQPILSQQQQQQQQNSRRSHMRAGLQVTHV